MRKLKQELSEETYDRDCKGTLWLLRKDNDDLNDNERKRLRRSFRHVPDLQQAYALRQELTAIFDHTTTISAAERRLKKWIKKAQRLQASCFKPFIKTLIRHWQWILNYFASRVTSGFVEGLNNKIKTIKRRCYGIRKTKTLFQRLSLDLQGYQSFL